MKSTHRSHAVLPLALIAAFALGCGDSKPNDPSTTKQDGSAKKTDVEEDLDARGSVIVGEVTLDIATAGEFVAGEEVDVELAPTKGADQIVALRAWFGTESGEGSMKSLAHSHGDHMDAMVELPDPLQEGATLWVEVETADGKSATSVDIRD